MSTLRRLLRREGSRDARRGQALVEFALIFPVLMIMLIGIFDAGRLVFAYNDITNAARSGARVAIVNQAAGADETSFDLSCDGAVCHMGGGGLPSAAAPLNLPGGFSFTGSFKSRFTSPILPQPQRPPLSSIS